jgi:diadenosine tetraphosphate (Ap4A) HIT family hydrolase
MGNELEQLHVHAIPRYRSSQEWGGIVIKDVRWGQNPSPKPASPFTETEVYAFSKFMMNELDRYLSRKASKNELRILSADI